jgi:putative inorganic carbon (HCO3(-)) transporter
MSNTVQAGSVTAPNSLNLERLKPGALWRALWTQSPGLWFIQLYVFFEYVRPQTIYPWFDVLPWSQISLLGAVSMCAFEGRYSFKAKELWACILLLTGVMVVSSVTAYSPSVAWENKDLWINWLLLMLVVGAGVRNKRELILFLLAFGLWNLKMTQHGVRGWASIGFGFRAIGIGGAPGWFHNSGEFGIEMCVFLPLSAYFAYGVWPKIGTWAKRFMVGVVASALISMIASSSRGALVGAAAVGLWVVWRTPQRARALLFVSVASVVVWLSVPRESKDRFNQIGDDQSSTTRITYWKHGIEIANNHPIFGIGYKNWLPYYTTHYNPKGQVPHNFMVEAVSELGYVGFLSLSLLLVMSFRTTAAVRHRTGPKSGAPDRLLWALAYGLDGALIGFMVSGSFVSVLYYPYLWMNTAMVMALVRVESVRLSGAAVPVRSSAAKPSRRLIGGRSGRFMPTPAMAVPVKLR